MRKSNLIHCAILLLLSAATTAHAADFVTYTDRTTFLAALASYEIDTYDDLAYPAAPIASPLNRTIGAYQYSAESSNGLYTAGESASDVWLSNDTKVLPIDFTITAGNPTAVGGYFIPVNLAGVPNEGVISVSINGGQFLQSVLTDSPTNFFGWISTNGTQVTSISVYTNGLPWPAINDLVLGQAVPEPSTYALGTLAALTLAFVSRRRMKS